MNHQLRFFLFLLLSGLHFTAWSQEVSTTMEDAMINPESVSHLELNCATNECNEFIRNMTLFVSLDELKLRNVANARTIRQIQSLNISTLEIEGSISGDAYRMLREMSGINSLQRVVLDNCVLTDVPKRFRRMGVNSFSATNSQTLDSRAIEALTDLPNLRQLDLTDNNLTAVPRSIGQMRQLEVLNLSGNFLTTLPTEVKQLTNLKEINLEGNILTDIQATMKLFENADLERIFLDESVPASVIAEVKLNFPSAKVFAGDDEVQEDVNEPGGLDSLELARAKKGTSGYGKLNATNGEIRALSPAYAHYAEIFRPSLFQYTFDTTLFEQRYLDTSYVNVWKITETTDVDKIQLSFFKKAPKDEIWFDFRRYEWRLTWNTWFWWPTKDRAFSSYLYRNNAEVNAYNGLKWVYTGPLSKKEFKQKYIKDKYWTDFRIYYNSEEQSFKFELKEPGGFVEIPVTVRDKNVKIEQEETLKTCVQRYARYTRGLERRAKRFHMRLNRNKRKYEREKQRNYEAKWKTFSKHYLSQIEREMTRDNWLAYYDAIIQNEQEAMDAAPATMDNIINALKLDSYRETFAPITMGSGENQVRAVFKDMDDQVIAVKQLLLVERGGFEMVKIPGQLGARPQTLNLYAQDDPVLIVELRDGRIGYVTEQSMNKYWAGDKRKFNFHVKVYPTDVAHVGMIRIKTDL